MDQWPVCSGAQIRKKNRSNSTDMTLLVKRTLHRLSQRFDDCVKHIFREHNQEADYWANLGAEGRRKIIVDRGSNNLRWKAAKGHWGGSSKNKGRSGRGVVVKGADEDKWITISKVAVSLGVGTVMAAEVMGVCVLTSIPDLVLHKVSALKITNQCIDTILTNQ